MAVFRIEKTRDYTVMSNHHLRDMNLSLKAKGLLSMMLSLPEDWNYTTRGLAKICKAVSYTHLDVYKRQVCNPAAVNVEINGYADLWDSSLADNLGIIANYRVINGMALKVMGESYNTEDTALIEEAGARLLELAPNVRLIKDDNLQDDIISGEVGAAVMYTSQVTMAMMANPELEVVFPEEGIGLGIMAMFIPSQAPNADAAYQFIDYILRPEISAQCFEYMGYYCTNLAAEEHISEEYRSFLTLPDHFGETEMIQPISAEAEEVHNRVWTEFRSACGQ